MRAPHHLASFVEPDVCWSGSNYMMFEVLETSWGTLQERLDSARTLDDLINAHKTYLSDIMCRALLHDDGRDISAKLEEVKAFCPVRTAFASFLRERGARAATQSPSLDKTQSRPRIVATQSDECSACSIPQHPYHQCISRLLSRRHPPKSAASGTRRLV